MRKAAFALAFLSTIGLLGGCPQQNPAEFVPGGVGQVSTIGAVASVNVFSPLSDLSITGGTPVEVNWTTVATTNFAELEIVFDPDQDPTNDNEVTAASNIQLSENTALLDTTDLAAGTYSIGVVLYEQGELTTFDYAPGRLIVNQRPQFFFNSPRDNFAYDRSPLIVPSFTVNWTVFDPDSTVAIEIYLDPDDQPNGNEILLRESSSQTGDEFSFNLPTSGFEAGTYRLLALVNDGVDDFPFYAPGSIVLRARLAYVQDLRLLGEQGSPIPGAVFEGFNPRDNAGSFVTSTTDIDRDGFSDFLIVAQFGKPLYQSNVQRTGVGEAYLVHGRTDRFIGRINLNSTGTLFRGIIFGGVPESIDPVRPSRGITSFTVLSDWDQDGFREIAFGLPFTDSLALTAAGLDNAGYFRSGGVVVASSSSLRPDIGFPGRDFIDLSEYGTVPHAPFSDPPECPEGFYGPKAPNSAGGVTYFHRHLFDPTPLSLGSIRLGARISTNDFGDQCGEVISAYDFNSLIISVPNRDPFVNTLTNFSRNNSMPGAGAVSVYFCPVFAPSYPWENSDAIPAVGDYRGLGANDDSALSQLPHGGPYHYILDDLRLFDGPGGAAFTGSPGYAFDDGDNSPPTCQLTPGQAATAAPDTNRTTRFYGGFAGARLGNAYAAGDFNVDGLQDILIGSPLSNEARGACFIVFGRLIDLVRGGELSVEELGLPLNSSDPQQARIYDGIRVLGEPNERLGDAQASAGDFNGDGIADVVIGSSLANTRRGGVAVMFGSRELINLTETEIPFAEIPQRGLGVIFVGEEEGDLLGARVVSAGDVDGDGLDDILMAAPNKSVRADTDLDGTLEIDRVNCGAVYLIYGSRLLTGSISVAQIGTEALPGAVFVGAASADFLGAGLGEQGDRSYGIVGVGDVDGDGRRDLLLGSINASPRDRVHAGEAYLIYGQGD